MTPFLLTPYDGDLFSRTPIYQYCKITNKNASPIQDLHFSLNSNMIIISSRKFQLIESYAFLKSTLRMRQTLIVLLAKATTSLTSTIPSTNIIPLPKVKWLWDRSLYIINLSLVANILRVNLNRDFAKEIGLKSPKWEGGLNLGIKVISMMQNYEVELQNDGIDQT